MSNRGSNPSTGRASIPLPWWLHPAIAFVLLNAVAAVATLLTSDDLFLQLWRTPKYYSLSDFVQCALYIVCFLFGAGGLLLFYPREGSRQAAPQEWALANEFLIRTLFRAALAGTVVGYVIWILNAYSHGFDLSLVTNILRGQFRTIYRIKEEQFKTIPGLTTLTQLAPAVGIFGALLGSVCGWRTVRTSLIFLLALTSVRAFILSERLAILEVVLPGFFCYIACRYFLDRTVNVRRILFASTAPILAAVALFGLFATAEYYRSWKTAYAARNTSFVGFSAYRMLGYYTTAVNNSAYLLQHVEEPVGVPMFTARWLWTCPVVKDIGDYGEQYLATILLHKRLLQGGANPEFNNMGGLLTPAMDFGYTLGGLFWILSGIACAILFRQFESGSPVGMLLYPMMFLAVLESPRLLYLSGGRVVPSIGLLVLCCCLIKRGAPADVRVSPRLMVVKA